MRKSAVVPRVLMLVENNSYPKDPRVRREAEALAKAGYMVSVISPAEKQQGYHARINGVEVCRFPAPPPANTLGTYLYEYAYSMMAMSILTFWIFIRHGFDVIHVANPPDTLALVAAPYKLLRKRLVFDHHDLTPELYYARFLQSGKPWVYRVLIWCEKVSCLLADHILATNESYKAIEISRDSVSEASITIVRNGPELKKREPDEPDQEVRQRAGTIIVYAGILGVQDGVDFLLRALRHLVFDLTKSDLLCLVIGKGDAQPALERQAEELSIADHILFTGWIDDPDRYHRYIASADICVDSSPSNAYNDRCTTIKMMEYMAAGKPIVAFDLPEHRFTAQASAIYARPNDEMEFARAIAGLIDDPTRRQALGAIGRRRIEEQLAWDYSASRLLEAYSILLAGLNRRMLPLLGPKASVPDAAKR
jgi:glycosyltransferase involved in cell wall biosynthesis